MSTVRVDDNIKKDVMPILNDLGISLSEAINMFLHQIKINNGIPLELKRTNKEFEDEINKELLSLAPDTLIDNMDLTEKLMLLEYYLESPSEREKEEKEAIPFEECLKKAGLTIDDLQD